jgi:hypothetical protein
MCVRKIYINTNIRHNRGDLFTSIDALSLSLTSELAKGAGQITSGTYDLRLAGTFLVDGAGFTGRAVSDIPELVSLALVGLRLAGMVRTRWRKAVEEAAAETI